MILDILYKSVIVASVEIDEKTKLTQKLMNEDRVISDFVSTKVLPLRIGCYIVVNGLQYTIRKLPTMVKNNDDTFSYTVLFESELDAIKDKLLFSSDGLKTFPYVGTAADFINMLVGVINQIKTGWLVGEVDASELVKIDFDKDDCYSALYKIAEAFGYEFLVVGKTIHLKAAIGTLKAVTFEYGETKGLYAIERRLIANSELYTRVFGFGGSQNLPYTYRNNAKNLVFEKKYLEKEITTYGVKEGYYVNEEIFPKRTGTLTEADTQFIAEAFDVNASYVADTSIDFDLNAALMEGLTAKIVFKSGDLANYEFDIWKYDAATKRIYYNPVNESNGFSIPNKANVAKIGDTYTLINIDLPVPYVIAAEADLEAATQVYLDKNSIPKTMYVVKMDQKFVKITPEVINIGDLVNVKDTEMGIDRAIRIAQLSYPLVNPTKKEAIIADEIPYIQKQLINNIASKASKAVQAISNKITNIENITNVSSKTSVTNVYTTEYPEPNIIVINGRAFKFIKHFDNIENPTILEANDIITGNYFDRYTLVKKWQYLGGDTMFKENYEQIETIDFTPEA